MKFSLIVATLNRKKELDILLLSLKQQKYKNFEVIIVDQNKNLIDNIVKKYSDIIDIKHIKVDFKGLSKARNIGLRSIIGDIVAFVDDDCEYLPDTLTKVYDKIEKEGIDILSTKIIDKYSLEDVGIKWGRNEKIINKNNMFKNSMSASLFINTKILKNIFFDENFGVGAKYGSAEESDYLLKLLKQSPKTLYTPDIYIYHPLHQNIFDLQKEFNYAKGLGAFYKKHIKEYSNFLILLKIFIKPAIGIVLNFYNNNSLKYLMILKGRIYGFFKYR